MAPWAAPALRSDPERVRGMFGYLEGRMGTCFNCLWFLLLCRFSVAVPWGKLFTLDGLNNSLQLFAVSKVALVCHGHSGGGAW